MQRKRGDRRHKQQVTFRLKPDLLAKLRAHSEETGLTQTKIVERSLEQRFTPTT